MTINPSLQVSVILGVLIVPAVVVLMELGNWSVVPGFLGSTVCA